MPALGQKLLKLELKEFKDEKGYYYGLVNKETSLREGLGISVNVDGSLYEGSWLNNQSNGRARLIHSDGDIYDGEWLNDKNHG